ncbi:MAG: Ada Zn binding protein [Patescibacteria group bacterium]|nr:Ada Zn binding protein [Patescibacteria group bacterium]
MKKEYFLVLLIILVGLASFGMGRLSVKGSGEETENVEFIVPELSKINMDFSGFGYLASINGTKYYPRGCKTANRIKPDNRVYFKSGVDASKTGYERSSSC